MKFSEKLDSLKIQKALDFMPHPNVILGINVDKSVTEGGVIKPESAQTETPTAKIVAIGDNVQKNFGDFLKKGDEVYLIKNYITGVVEINGVDLYLIPPDAIIGVKHRPTFSVNGSGQVSVNTSETKKESNE